MVGRGKLRPGSSVHRARGCLWEPPAPHSTRSDHVHVAHAGPRPALLQAARVLQWEQTHSGKRLSMAAVASDTHAFQPPTPMRMAGAAECVQVSSVSTWLPPSTVCVSPSPSQSLRAEFARFPLGHQRKKSKRLLVKSSVHHSVCPNSVSEAEAIPVVVSFLCGEELLSRSGLLHIFPAEPLAVLGSRLSLRGCQCTHTWGDGASLGARPHLSLIHLVMQTMLPVGPPSGRFACTPWKD